MKQEHSHAQVIAALQASTPNRVLSLPLTSGDMAAIDLSIDNPLVAASECRDNGEITQLLKGVLDRAGARYGIGGYAEKRAWYARGAQFASGGEVRSVHLGIDLWVPSGEPVFSPYDAVVHSAKDNDLPGDYGPTVVLKHSLGGITFYTLYGHLSIDSLEGKESGTVIKQGQRFAAVGAPPRNGDWPPHLHFQIMLDMAGYVGDYPGVAAESQRDFFLTRCPDPNLILRSPLLGGAPSHLSGL